MESGSNFNSLPYFDLSFLNFPGISAGAKVAWRSLAYPKSEGGLGLRDIESWNNACALKLFWMLFFRAGSIWVAWIRNMYLSTSPLWALNEENGSLSWMFRKVLKLRRKALQFLSIKFGNGDSTFFWWDPWTPFGPLSLYLGEEGPSCLGIPISATVSDVWSGNGWLLPPARSNRQVLLHAYLMGISCNSSIDMPIWSVNGIPRKSFSLKDVWNGIRDCKSEVFWAPLLWHRAGLGRHQITTWLFLLNRNPTLDRISSWGYETEGVCLLCGSALESRDHLFFECSYSASIWRKLMGHLSFSNIPIHWNQILHWFQVVASDEPTKLALLRGGKEQCMKFGKSVIDACMMGLLFPLKWSSGLSFEM
ncbi:unnamed protein product [Microthlaspi erraticum]|uniref:Reverse transcriptase zinc-binding domain-containing protein n=1 Tax=Microthlaspi erraticum TaxID=1685480 RepID=A0A6D2K2Z2_9BRAS|nr:unnamed protein product [Microthlaspi erraticum]